MTKEQAEDLKALMADYLTDKDARYRRLLASLDDNQIRHACGAFAQGMAFGTVRAEDPPTVATGGFAATCVRMAIFAGFAEGNGYQKGDPLAV